MKKLLFAAAATLATILTGCKYEPSSTTFSYRAHLWNEVVAPGQTTKTTNIWGEIDGAPRIVAVEQTRNGALVYKDADFKYESAYSGNPTQFTRTIAQPTSATELYKNTYSDKYLQLTAEVYLNGETTPSQWMRRDVDVSGRITRQESEDKGVHTVFSNYRNDGSSGAAIYYDAVVTTDGVPVNNTVRELFTNNERRVLIQREIFAGDNMISVEAWGTTSGDLNGSYMKYVGTKITYNNGKLEGATLVVDQSTPEYIYAGTAITSTATRKEYDPTTGALVTSSTIRNGYEMRMFTY